MPRKVDRLCAFTLIELLLVVGIIAILSAIAVPNFLEAQTRSKVSRARADMKSLQVAVETYGTDYSRYPVAELFDGLTDRLVVLTTPVSYITSIPADPFFLRNSSWYAGLDNAYCYAPGNIYFGGNSSFDNSQYRYSIYSLASRGPDGRMLFGYCAAHPLAVNNTALLFTYDPTNGTVSRGEVFRLGSGTLGGD